MLFPNLPDRHKATLLTLSERLLVYKVYEQGIITDGEVFADAGTVYGDPTCAAIADDESWCAIGGASVWVRVSRGGGDVMHEEGTQLHHLSHVRWVEALWPLGDRLLGFVSNEGGKRRVGVLNVDTFEIDLPV